jgi:serine/threonine protein kinase
MDTEKTCQHCGKAIGAASIEGLCPECLMKMGMGLGSEATGAEAHGKRPFIPPSVAEIAPRFPQFEVLSLIGFGGMGAVYKARQKQLERLVALKVLPPGIGADAAFADRFAREARAMAQLNHPGIVTIHDFGCADGLYYFVMEFVDGVSLRQLMHTGRISPRESLAIVPQICDALQYAHDHGIVHRDIKPENILLDRQGRVKVADFGLAKLVGALDGPEAQGAAPGSPALTEAGKLMGTPNYMAPEQVGDPGAVDHRADIYGLGVMFYQMLTGELPRKPIEPPSRKVQIDVRLDDVVLRALANEPERRYQQVSQVKTAVETITQSSTPDSTGNESRSSWKTLPRSALTTIYNIRGRVLVGVLALLVLWFLLMFVRARQSQIAAEMARAQAAEMAATPISVLAFPAEKGDIRVCINCLGVVASTNTVDFAIPESYVQEVVHRFDTGQALAVEAYDRQFDSFGRGFLQGVSNSIDVATGTLQCKARFAADGDHLAVPGLFLNIRMLLEVKHDVLRVPFEAVVRDQSAAFVWVINPDQTVTRRPVRIGVIEPPEPPNQDILRQLTKRRSLEGGEDRSSFGQWAEVQEGLSSGDLVVVGPADISSRLHEGRKVRHDSQVEPSRAGTQSATSVAGFYYVDGGGIAIPARRVFQPGLTVAAAIKASGGLTPGALKEKAQLTRAGSNQPLTIDLNAIEKGTAPDLEIKPGDKLWVPSPAAPDRP